MLRLTRGSCLSTTVLVPEIGPGRRGSGKKVELPRKGKRAKRPPDPIAAGQEIQTNGDWKNRRTSGECCFLDWGRRRPLFYENLYGLTRAADGKVPLLMGCVKRKPLHLVFYAQLGESRAIIPGFCLCRIAGRRMGHGSKAAGAPVRWGGTKRPGRIREMIHVPWCDVTRR